MIKGSRSKDNFYLWIFKSTSCVTLNDERKTCVKKDNDNIPKERVSDTMLEHHAQQLVSERERKPNEIINHLLGCQVS